MRASPFRPEQDDGERCIKSVREREALTAGEGAVSGPFSGPEKGPDLLGKKPPVAADETELEGP